MHGFIRGVVLLGLAAQAVLGQPALDPLASGAPFVAPTLSPITASPSIVVETNVTSFKNRDWVEVRPRQKASRSGRLEVGRDGC